MFWYILLAFILITYLTSCFCVKESFVGHWKYPKNPDIDNLIIVKKDDKYFLNSSRWDSETPKKYGIGHVKDGIMTVNVYVSDAEPISVSEFTLSLNDVDVLYLEDKNSPIKGLLSKTTC